MAEGLWQFQQELVEARTILRRAAAEALVSTGATAVHQFGSLGRGGGDELSDLDLWASFEDRGLPAAVAGREALYARVAPVLLQHENPRNRPLGGAYSLVLHQTPAGLCQVDYYFSARSKTRVPAGAVLLRGIEMPRGDWLLEKDESQEETWASRVAFLACMTFILGKGVVRGWPPEFFERTRLEVLELTGAAGLPAEYDFGTLIRMLRELDGVGDPVQRAALGAIGAHLAKLGRLYR